jgi:predicted NBD/HSP70 family sugar kinase
MPIRQILEDRFSLPTFLDQDANACALAEKMFGDMRESNNFVFLLADGGLGGGIFTNGNIYRGEHDIAGEIGHTTIDINGPQCSCGNVGCLELYASPHAVEQFVASELLASPQNENPSFFNSPDSVTFENITQAARNGDALSCAALDRMAHALAAGIVNLINSFDPEAVVIGGKIALAQDLIADRVNQMVRQRTLSGNALPVPVRFSSLGQEVQIVGAFSLVLRELFQNPVSPEKSTR